MTPIRKRNGQLACGCRPYHEHGPEGFRLCAEGKVLYRAMLELQPWTSEGHAAHDAYVEHIGLRAEQPAEVAG